MHSTLVVRRRFGEGSAILIVAAKAVVARLAAVASLLAVAARSIRMRWI